MTIIIDTILIIFIIPIHIDYKESERYKVYKDWFTDTTALIMRKMKPMSYAIFLQ